MFEPSKPSLHERLFSDLPDFLAVIDRDLRLVMCNWRGGYQYVPDEQRQGNPLCYDVFYPGQGKPCEPCHVREVFSTGAPLVTEKFNPRIGHLEVRCFPVFDDAGQITMVAEQICDIGQRKDAEMALQHSEKRYRTLVENQMDAICRWRPDGTLTFVNNAYCRMLGKSRDQLLGSRFIEFVPESHRPSREAHLASLVADPRIAQFEHQGSPGGGSDRWYIWSDRPIMDETGQLVEFQSVARDITDIRQALEDLRQSEERYREFFENDLTAVFVATVDGQLLECNPAFARIFGFSSPEFAKRCDLATLHVSPDARERLLEEVRRQKKLQFFELDARTRKGKPLHLIANIVGEFDDQGELTRIRGYLFDNTELKNLEKQFLHAQKMEAMGRLAGGVAHDFNNLLTVISGYSQYLLQNSPDDPLRNCLEQIARAADQAAALTSQLLTFSRRQVRQARELSLNKVTADLEDMLRRILTADIEIVVIRDPRLGLVKADYGQIEQVIVNLVVNARDAMPRGGKLTIETLNVEFDEIYSHWHVGLKPGPYVMLSVTDTGIGMDSETMSRVFEPFFTTKDKGKGTGLGLSTVYGIVQQSGGQVYVYSEPGLGTTFKVYLPNVEAAVQSRCASPAPSRSTRGAETVLLVEDNDAVRDLAHMVLQGSGYTVLQARNAREAVEVFENSQLPIDVLLTDVVMPGGSGVSLAAELKRRQPDLKLLLVSGYPQDALEDQSIWDAGAHFLQKPFSPVSLGLKMREVLGGNDLIRVGQEKAESDQAGADQGGFFEWGQGG